MKRVSLTATFLAAGLAVAAAQPPPEPPACTAHADAVAVVVSRGASNYALGLNLGRATRLLVASRLAGREATAARAFSETPAGAVLLDKLTANANATFPRFVEELAGLAEGANVSFRDVMVLNAMDELEVLMPPWPPAGGARAGHCTDVLVGPPAAGGAAPRLVAHNEDAETSEFGQMFLLDATLPLVSGGGQLSFTAYMYAGMLASEAFAYNDAGVYFTTNALFPRALNEGGVPRAFVQRHLLEARSVADAAARLAAARVACGFSANLGGVGSAVGPGVAALRNVELSAVLPADTRSLGAGETYYHANSYLRSPTPQFDDASSDARLARLAQLPAPRWPGAALDAQRLLSDEANATFPVYRSGAGDDCCATVMTALIEVSVDARGEEVGTLTLLPNRPSDCPAPVLQRTFAPRANAIAPARPVAAGAQRSGPASRALLQGA